MLVPRCYYYFHVWWQHPCHIPFLGVYVYQGWCLYLFSIRFLPPVSYISPDWCTPAKPPRLAVYWHPIFSRVCPCLGWQLRVPILGSDPDLPHQSSPQVWCFSLLQMNKSYPIIHNRLINSHQNCEYLMKSLCVDDWAYGYFPGILYSNHSWPVWTIVITATKTCLTTISHY